MASCKTLTHQIKTNLSKRKKLYKQIDGLNGQLFQLVKGNVKQKGYNYKKKTSMRFSNTSKYRKLDNKIVTLMKKTDKLSSSSRKLAVKLCNQRCPYAKGRFC